MRYLLQVLKRGSHPFRIGRYTFITYPDATMCVRQDNTGLMSLDYKINKLGFGHALAWIEEMEIASGNDLVYR